MAAYYIDYENVGSTGLAGLDKLTETDRLLLFYSDRADTIKMEVVEVLMHSPCHVEFLKIERGTQNALDFQLITMLYSTEKGENTCYIISKDNGYDASIKMANKLGLQHIQRRSSIDAAVRSEMGAGAPEPEVIEGTQPESKKEVPHIETKKNRESRNTKKGHQTKNEVSEKAAAPTTVPAPAPVEEEKALKEAATPTAGELPESAAEIVTTPEKIEKTENTETGKKQQEALSQEQIQEKIAQVLTKQKVEATPDNCKLVEQALTKTKDKYEFYRYFTRRLGQNKGREFYRSIRGGYQELAQLNLYNG